MSPKCIIIKTQSKDFFNLLTFKLHEIKNIRFLSLKINGFYTTVVKCHNYYDSKSVFNENQLYGSYIFLYSIISIIISELLIICFEHSISKRIIYSSKDEKININKLSNISALLLDEYSPFEFSKLLHKKRKNYILESLFANFRKRNYIYTDFFLDFSSPMYIQELKDVIDASIQILNNKQLYEYMMNLIFQNKS